MRGDLSATEIQARASIALNYERRLSALEAALREIADPIAAMRARAEAEGAALNGEVAYQLSSNADYLKGIARRALGSQ